MLQHGHNAPEAPARVVTLGSGGFIGGACIRRVAADRIPVLPLGRSELDLLAPDAAARLAALLRPTDSLVVVSARAPCKDVGMLVDNIRMIEAVCGALAQVQPAHLVYVSSDAVYKDSAEPMDEAWCAEPGSLHGVMHLAREIALRGAFKGPMAILRPTLVYGAADPHNGYGPNRFRRLAAKGEPIVLFGDGEERRDHVLVDDVAELLRLILVHRSEGVLNAATGTVASFREIAEAIVSGADRPVDIRTSPRVGPMPHNGYRAFDPSATRAAFPGFAYTPWREGLRRAGTEAEAPR
jgi:nucleoside-diphosphate-sugar epimerase